MKTLLPTASRKRLEELLEYLGKTEIYSEFHHGNRAEEFKECFDIESPWCWEYADIVLRGLKKRNLKYGEGHHIVPMAYYRGLGHKNAAVSRAMALNNYTVLKYSEHVYAHYCLAFASKGEFVDKMATAFQYMYYNSFRGKKKGKHEFPSEEEFEKFLSKADAIRAISRRDICAGVDAEGRTHMWEDPEKAKRESATASYWRNPEKVRAIRRKAAKELYDTDPEYREKKKAKARNYCHQNPEKNAERNRKYREEHKEELDAKNRAYRASHKEEKREYNKKYREEHRDELHEKDKALRERRGDFYNANRRAKRANDPEWREKDNARRRERRKNDPEFREHTNRLIRERRKNNPEVAEKQRARCREYQAKNKPTLKVKAKKRYDANREKYLAAKKDRYEAKKAAGYRLRRDPDTGKRRWVFVGLQTTTETPNSTSGAA